MLVSIKISALAAFLGLTIEQHDRCRNEGAFRLVVAFQSIGISLSSIDTTVLLHDEN